MEETQQHSHLLSGRRDFDRQFQLLAIAVHTLQRDFAALEERAASTQQALDHMSQSVEKLTEKLHGMDKALVTKIATITVTERALWALGSAMLGMIVHFL